MLPTVLLDLDVKGYCSIIGCVLKSEFYAALTGSHIMTPRIRTATGLKLISDLTVVTGPPRHRSDTGWTRAKRTMTHTIICHSAVPWCHTGRRVLSAFYPTQSLNGNDMTFVTSDATTLRSAMRRQGRVTRQLRWRHLIVAEVQLCPEYKSSWRPPTCTR